MDKKNIGKFLKELRTEKGLTQTEFSLQFSKFCGIDTYGGFSCAAISKWERGEALPDLYNLRDIAKYYGVTVNEILEGRRHISFDYDELYFGEFNRKERECQIIENNNEIQPENIFDKFDKILAERNNDIIKIQIHAENRYRRLLVAMAHNSISRTEEDEFDFLCLSYFKQYYCFEKGNSTIKSFNSNNLKHIKIDIKKLANSLTSCSDEELLFEINRRYCVCNFMPIISVSGVYKRFSDIRHHNAIELCYISDREQIYYEFVKSLSPWDKDALLIATLEDNICFDNDEFPYYDEDEIKCFIKSIIECGSTINHAIKFKRVLQNKTRYIAQELARLHKEEFRAHTVVYDTTHKQYVELKHYSSDFRSPIFTPEHRKEYAELEKRLLAGENELERQYLVIRGKSVYDITYQEYMHGRDEQLTDELYKNLDDLSFEEIKNNYFVEKGVIL